MKWFCKRSLAVLASYFTIMAGLNGCNFHEEKQSNRPQLAGTQGLQVSYAQVRDTILVPKCISCHGQSGGVNLESYASVKSNLNRIEQTVLNAKRMPPSQPLPENEAELLNTWVRNGAPEMAVPTAAVPSPLPLPSTIPGREAGTAASRGTIETFDQVKAQIFAPKCISCHGRAGGVNLESAQAARSAIAQIEQAVLVEKRMPPNGGLSNAEAELVAAWIETETAESYGGTSVGHIPQQPPTTAVSSCPQPPIIPTAPLEPPHPIAATQLSFANLRDKVFAPRCVGCHGNLGGVSLQTIEDVRKNLALIVIATQVEKVMPPGSPLTTEQNQLLITWVKAGAPKHAPGSEIADPSLPIATPPGAGPVTPHP